MGALGPGEPGAGRPPPSTCASTRIVRTNARDEGRGSVSDGGSSMSASGPSCAYVAKVSGALTRRVIGFVVTRGGRPRFSRGCVTALNVCSFPHICRKLHTLRAVVLSAVATSSGVRIWLNVGQADLGVRAVRPWRAGALRVGEYAQPAHCAPTGGIHVLVVPSHDSGHVR